MLHAAVRSAKTFLRYKELSSSNRSPNFLCLLNRGYPGPAELLEQFDPCRIV